MDCAVLADARGDPGVPANDYSIAWSARGNPAWPEAWNPLGRLPGEKQFADQLRIVLAEPVDKNDPKSVRKLRRIAEKLVECALNGEPWANRRKSHRRDPD